MATIFYSWQSDTPSKTNRGFIRDALDRAIKRIATDFDVEDALRVDQDTQGVPGNPPIADTILRKIDACDIFVPDLTFVAKTERGKPVPNPNVLIELGYAMKSKGDNLPSIFVMNEAFGQVEEGLPFDLRHKRRPICYTLPDDAPAETLRQVREQLVKDLTGAIRTILDSGIIQAGQQPSFQEMQPVWKSSSFLQDGDLFVQHVPPFGLDRQDRASNIFWRNVPQAFLRLIPTKPTTERSSSKLRQLVREHNLIPFGGTLSAWTGRNEYGAVIYDAKDQKRQTAVDCISQVFKNGEIWGIDKRMLDGNVIPSSSLEIDFEATLSNYLQFAQHGLLLDLPLKFVAGLSDVKGFRLGLPPNKWGEEFRGPVVDDVVVDEGVIDDYGTSIHELLLPFFRMVWDACDCPRPEWFRKQN